MVLYKMFKFIKKVVILVLMSVSSVMTVKNYLLLQDQKCALRKVIIDNDYMTFPYKIKVDKCVGSCNDEDNPCFKVCTPDIAKIISVNVFNLISQKKCVKKYHLS